MSSLCVCLCDLISSSMGDLSNIVHTYDLEVIAPHLGIRRVLDTAWQPACAAGCGRNDPEIKLSKVVFLLLFFEHF